MTWVYRPNHPEANEFGMVHKSLVIGDPSKRSSLSAPMVQSDSMDALMHHGTGKIMDSKSAFRKKTKELGLVEFGNEPPKPAKPKRLSKEDRKKDIARAITQLGG